MLFCRSLLLFVSALLAVLASADLAPCVAQQSEARLVNAESAIVFSGVSDCRQNSHLFGVGPGSGFCRPFCFSKNSRWFAYTKENQCIVVDAIKGNVVQASFLLVNDFQVHSKVQSMMVDSSRGNLFVSWNVPIIANASDDWNKNRKSQLIRADFADVQDNGSFRFHGEVNATSENHKAFRFSDTIVNEGLILVANDDGSFQFLDEDFSSQVFGIAGPESGLDSSEWQSHRASVSATGEYVALIAPLEEGQAAKFSNADTGSVGLRLFSTDGNLKEVFLAENGNPVFLRGNVVAFSPTRNFLAVAVEEEMVENSSDQTANSNRYAVELLDLDTKQKVARLDLTDPFSSAPCTKVKFLSFDSQGEVLLAVAESSNGQCKLLPFDVSDNRLMKRATGKSSLSLDSLSDIAISGSTDMFATVDNQGIVVIRRILDLEPVVQFESPGCNMLQFSLDGTRLVCSCKNGRLTIFDIAKLR